MMIEFWVSLRVFWESLKVIRVLGAMAVRRVFESFREFLGDFGMFLRVSRSYWKFLRVISVLRS